MVRVRFAPSPTGYLHVGGARTALFNWLFARKHGGAFLLRIEDTDKARSTDASTRAIFEGLTWLGLTWDEDVVYQGAPENLARHQRDARALLDSGAAYRCFCTTADLDARRKDAEARGEAFRYDRRCDRLDAADVARRVAAGEPHTVRFRVPEGTTGWTDLVHGEIAFPNKDLDDLVILRSDGTPIYNMAVVSDDIAMRITHVMRGDDHISNTPKQILLYRALGAALPVFAHFPMIHGTDGKKLSKRHGATAVGDYQHLGILPGAMLNFLALLGWSPGGDREVMTRDEMVARFDEAGFLAKASVFDPKKLEWMNGQHLASMDRAALTTLVVPKLIASGRVTDASLALRADRLEAALRLVQDQRRARTVDEVVAQALLFVADGMTYDDAALAKAWKDPADACAVLVAARDTLAACPTWDRETYEGALTRLGEARALPPARLLGPIRAALTGQANSPSIHDMLGIFGRDESLARIDAALAHPRLAGAA
jgi:glutamyl-tRNA synthetase